MNSQLKSQLLNVLVQKMKQEDNGLTNYYDKATLDKINYSTEEILFWLYPPTPKKIRKPRTKINYLTEEILLKMEEKRLRKIKEVVTPRKRVCKKDPDYYYY